jgi:NAD(P)-dependent dehydrogenase (short-subunit alcohol dehydrogenase family)
VKDFKGKVAVVTGSASGMGRAVIGRAAREGMKCVLADIEQTALDRAVNELKAEGAEAIGVKTDVSKPESLQALLATTLDTFGAVHLLHNNAGVGGGAAFWETSLRDWDWVMGVNYWGPILGVWAFLPTMLKQDTECHIVTTSSMGGLIVNAFLGTPYGVAKFGVVALMETLSHELTLMGAKIGVSVLCPGQVNTNISHPERNRPAELTNDPEWVKKVEEQPHIQAMRKHLESEEFAAGAMDPSLVGDMVFEAIMEDKFYIYTHPEWMGLATMRAEAILSQSNPTAMSLSLLGE